MAEKKANIETLYTGLEAGRISFDVNLDLENEITACLELVTQIMKDYQGQNAIQEGLKGLENELNDLRGSSDSPDAIRRQLDALMKVPLGEDKNIRLDAFRKTASTQKVESKEQYVEQVMKMVRNTRNNVALLLLKSGEDTVLKGFMDKLWEIKSSEYIELRGQMEAISQSPQLWHYNEKKKAYLAEWLLPFQDLLDKPIGEMSEEEIQAALKKVETLRNSKLEEMTHLMVESDREPFRRHNRSMNPLINGKDESFWGGTEARDEFLSLMNRLITRFSFNLEDRYLVFRTKDGGFAYLVGFSDEAFSEAVTTAKGQLALYPHLKVFVKVEEDDYAELSMEFFNRNSKAYYNSLKTAVVPFLQSAATMVEAEISDVLKGAFDMWT